MSMPRPTALFGLLLLMLSPLGAERIDLDRTKPVPADQQIPIQDFFRPGLMREPRINRSGTQIAALMSRGDKYNLLVWDVARRHASFGTPFGDLDVANPTWLDDNHVAFDLISEKYFRECTMVAKVGDIGGAVAIFQHDGAQLISVPRGDRMHPLYWLRAELVDAGSMIYHQQGPVVAADALRPASCAYTPITLMQANYSTAVGVVTNNQQHVARRYPDLPGVAAGYLADGNGNLSIGVSADAHGIGHVFRFADGGWTPCPIDLDQVELRGCGDDPDQLVVLGPRQEGKPRALQLMDARTGALGAVLIQDQSYDFDGWLFRDPGTQVIVGAEYDREIPTRVWFNPAYRKVQKLLDAFFSKRIVEILGLDAKADMVLVSVYSDRQPRDFYAVDLAHRRVTLVQQSAPWIDPKRMRPMHILRFHTRDGIPLDAYLTLPAGASKANPAPLIVYPHGGPFYRDNWGFRGDVQFLASRGYAVLQPNYRNSVGYQWRAPESDQWEFGKMSDDVTDATRAMLATGLVDPHRVAIVGGSFGGYLAISGAAHEPSLYRCAITIAGLFDWIDEIRDAKWNQYDNPQYVALRRHLGDPKTSRARLDAMSPINFVSRIRVPVFVFHGEDDLNVSVAQSHELVSYLKRYGIPYETMFVSGEGHGPRHLPNEVEMWGRIEAFLKTNLAP